MFCENCGLKIEDDAKFCDTCGTEVIQDEEIDEGKQKDIKIVKPQKESEEILTDIPEKNPEIIVTEETKETDQNIIPEIPPEIEKVIICKSCGASNNDDAIFCDNCKKNPDEIKIIDPIMQIPVQEKQIEKKSKLKLLIVLSVVGIIVIGIICVISYYFFDDSSSPTIGNTGNPGVFVESASAEAILKFTTPIPLIDDGYSLFAFKNSNDYSFLGFYSDGTVISVSSRNTSESTDDEMYGKVARWFNKNSDSSSIGTYNINGGEISFSVINSAGTIEYDGKIINNEILILNVKSNISDNESTKTYNYVGVVKHE